MDFRACITRCESLPALMNTLTTIRELAFSAPVEEEQIFAQAKLAASAIKALLTGSRIGHDHGISLNALCHARPCGGNDSGYFVTETSRRPLEEDGMTSLQRFEIGAASGRGSNLEQHFSGSWLRNRQFFQAKIERRVKAGGKHCLSSIAFIDYRRHGHKERRVCEKSILLETVFATGQMKERSRSRVLFPDIRQSGAAL